MKQPRFNFRAMPASQPPAAELPPPPRPGRRGPAIPPIPAPPLPSSFGTSRCSFANPGPRGSRQFFQEDPHARPSPQRQPPSPDPAPGFPSSREPGRGVDSARNPAPGASHAPPPARPLPPELRPPPWHRLPRGSRARPRPKPGDVDHAPHGTPLPAAVTPSLWAGSPTQRLRVAAGRRLGPPTLWTPTLGRGSRRGPPSHPGKLSARPVS